MKTKIANPVKDWVTTENAPTQEQKPAVIRLIDGSTLTVAHHFIAHDGTYVCAYDETRDGGIDHRVPWSSILEVDTSDATLNEVSGR